MVKGAARAAASSSQSATPQALPTMQAGQNPHDPLTQLNGHMGYGLMAGLNPFAEMGLNPNDPNMVSIAPDKSCSHNAYASCATTADSNSYKSQTGHHGANDHYATLQPYPPPSRSTSVFSHIDSPSSSRRCNPCSTTPNSSNKCPASCPIPPF